GELSGAGVAYKLAWRLMTLAHGSDRLPDDRRQLLLELLALAALGTIADVVPLLEENRVLARFGLSVIRSTRFVGLNALIEASSLDAERVSVEDVGFRLAPRLNACGRLGHAQEAVELLTTQDKKRAAEIAAELTRTNERRRAVEREIAAQAADFAEVAGMTGPDRRAIVLAHESWHPGVVGIVCSRLVERFGRPTILLQREGDRCAGSCRSVDGFDIHDALTACAKHLDSFGGHIMAAGVKLSADRLPAFTEAFIEIANSRLAAEDLVPSLRIDCDAALDELTPAIVERLERLGPFGAGNPTPRIRMKGLRLVGPPQPLGAHGKHLKITVRQNERMLRMMGWSWGEHR
ncbi:MAG: DHHA1 domain-containing protein, partial [Planctomycetota bacterium]|nr:DHHA1 domain-containing protein [Planctomycetota bacterium]